jgi:collagenase-like PrtC family protease
VPNLELSVPYNEDPATLNAIFGLKKIGDNTITEVYLSGPQEYSGSGRTMPRLEMDAFLDTVDKIHKEGLRVNLIMNSVCEGGDWYSPEVLRSKMEYLRQVHKEHGVESVTLANAIYIKEIRNRFPDIEIGASVLADIDCLQRAIIFKEYGADVITPDVNINRDLGLLKEIKETTGVRIKLMVNEGCLSKCPFRKFHFNYTAHKSKEVSSECGIFFDNCVQVSAKDPSQVLKSGWIRPEDLNKYSEITNYFKIVGRSVQRSKVIRCIQAYMQESWDGGLLDILCDSLHVFNRGYGVYLDNQSLGELKFFEKVSSCDKNCSRCSYCESVAKKLFRFREFSREQMEDDGLVML